MNSLSQEINFSIPLGAGEIVDTFGKELVKKYGKDILFKYAKLNFKNTNKILGNK